MKKNNLDGGIWTPLHITLFYGLFGALWIIFSDTILLCLVSDPKVLSHLQTFKGWFFILITASLLFGLMNSMISRRKTIQHELRQSEQYNRLLFELSPIGLVLCHMDGTLVDINSAYAGIIGRSVEETLQLSYWDVTPPIYAEQEQWQLKSLGETGRYGPYEKEYICKDGSLVPVRLQGLIIDKEGQKFIWSSVEDISEWKKAEKELKRNEQVLRLLVEHTPAAIAMFDCGMKYMVVSHRFLMDYNLGDQDIIGRSHYEVFPEVPEHWKEIHRRCLAGAVEKCEEDLFPRAGGKMDWVRWEIHPWHEPQGQIGGIILFSEVITKRKKAEVELKQHREHLEDLIQERTNALEESQRALMNIVEDLNIKTEELGQANTRLKELDRLKSMFIAAMSHELRTPLNSIIGFTGLIVGDMVGTISDEQRDMLGRVYRAGKHLLSLITDVIDIAKIESGKIVPYPEDFDLHELIDEAIGQVQQQAADKGLSIIQNLPEGPVAINSDRKRLLQCLLNYLSNAVKFSEKGTVTVEVKTTGTEVENTGSEAAKLTDGWLEISVRDAGIGIKEEDMKLLFGSFVRLATPLKTITPGTGLGLYLTKKLTTEVLDGTVGAESEEGRGSRFWLRMPIVAGITK